MWKKVVQSFYVQLILENNMNEQTNVVNSPREILPRLRGTENTFAENDFKW